jgi:hypothetical protein
LQIIFNYLNNFFIYFLLTYYNINISLIVLSIIEVKHPRKIYDIYYLKIN